MSGTIHVADAGAMIALLRGEPGGDLFLALTEDPENTIFAHGANLAEVFYDARRSHGEEHAQGALRRLTEAGDLFRSDFDPAFWQDLARIKADQRRVSLADCFGLALARRVGGTFLSTDRHELDNDAVRALCPIRFIR
ncbi:MAG: PIN domain-containing protein [Armatimonadetes bacterium]|nr:PIN domain-containing protein [Armatimonadota bacterium]